MNDNRNLPQGSKDLAPVHLELVGKDNNVSVSNDDKLGFWGTVRQNPVAMMWCTYMLFTCVMWGYDGLAASVVIALPQFRQLYGVPFMVSTYMASYPIFYADFVQDQYVVLAKWQLAFTGGSVAGSLIGGLGAGVSTRYVGERIPLGCAFGKLLVLTIPWTLQLTRSSHKHRRCLCSMVLRRQ